MTAPNASAIARVEKKVDDLAATTNAGMTSIVERLASIEATSVSEARERATIHSYTQENFKLLAGRLDLVVEKAVYDAEKAALVARVQVLEDRAKLWLVGLLFPIIATVVGAVIIAVILGH